MFNGNLSTFIRSNPGRVFVLEISCAVLVLVLQAYGAIYTTPSAVLTWGAVMSKRHISPVVILCSRQLSENKLSTSSYPSGHFQKPRPFIKNPDFLKTPHLSENTVLLAKISLTNFNYQKIISFTTF